MFQSRLNAGVMTIGSRVIRDSGAMKNGTAENSVRTSLLGLAYLRKKSKKIVARNFNCFFFAAGRGHNHWKSRESFECSKMGNES